MGISSYIYILLQSNGVATIPGFGVFQYIEYPACLEPNTESLRPPYAEIIFRSEHDENDIILIEKLITIEGLSKELALEKISGFVDFCKNKLFNDGFLVVENLGKIYKKPDGTIIIEPDKESPLFSKYEGLETIVPIEKKQSKAKTIKTSETTEDIEKISLVDDKIISEPKEIIIQYEKRDDLETSEIVEDISIKKEENELDEEEIYTSHKKNNLAKALVYIFLSLIMGAIIITYILNLYMFDKYIQEGVKYIGISPKLHAYFVDSTSIKQNKTDSLNKIQKVIDSINNINADTTWKDTVKLPYSKKQDIIGENNEMNAEPSNPPKYYVIAGCFREIENAQKQINILKNEGYQAVIAGKTNSGLLRVCFNNGTDNKIEALDLINKINNKRQTETWLIKY